MGAPTALLFAHEEAEPAPQAQPERRAQHLKGHARKNRQPCQTKYANGGATRPPFQVILERCLARHLLRSLRFIDIAAELLRLRRRVHLRLATPGEGTFHCFGCGEGGDAAAFITKIGRP